MPLLAVLFDPSRMAILPYLSEMLRSNGPDTHQTGSDRIREAHV
jgi:hypothetical protein